MYLIVSTNFFLVKPLYPGITGYSYRLLFTQRFFTVCTQRPQANKALCSWDGSVCGLESTFKFQASFKSPPAFTFYQVLWNLPYACDILLARNGWMAWAHICLCCTWTQLLVNLRCVENLSNSMTVALPKNPY